MSPLPAPRRPPSNVTRGAGGRAPGPARVPPPSWRPSAPGPGLGPRRRRGLPQAPLLIGLALVSVIAVLVVAALLQAPRSTSGRFPSGGGNGGSGGALPLVRLGTGQPAAPIPQLTSLVGVSLDSASPRLMRLIGTVDPNLPALSVRRLADYFAVALRSYYREHRAPAISIDPTPDQVRQGVNVTGNMRVRYEGGCGGTALGLLSFAADRRMKCLALGRDNLTGSEVGCTVPGFHNQLELALQGPASSIDSRNRFWIEPGSARVRISPDRRLVELQVEPRIAVKRQVARGGQLVDVDVQPDRPAREFAEHMSRNYATYAARDPVFAEVAAAAQMSVLARIVHERRQNADPADDLPLDVSYWLDNARYGVRSIRTPLETPAGRARKSVTRNTQTETEVQTVMAAGGVSYEPATYEARTDDTVASDLEALKRRATAEIGDVAQPVGVASQGPLSVIRCVPEHGDVTLKSAEGKVITRLSEMQLQARPNPDSSSCREIASHLGPGTPQGTAASAENDILVLGKDAPAEVCRWLGALGPAERCFAGRHEEMARQHLSGLQERTAAERNVDVVMEVESLDEGQQARLANYGLDVREALPETWLRSVEHVSPESDTVVIVGERGDPGGPVMQHLKSASREGRLAGKTLILFVCPSEEFQACLDSLFDDPSRAPQCVVAFGGKVRLDGVPRAMSEISATIAREPRIRPDRLLERVLERLAQPPATGSAPAPPGSVGAWARDMQWMQYKQVSERPPSRTPLGAAPDGEPA